MVELSLDKDGDRHDTRYLTSMAANEWSSVLTNMVADKTQEVRKMMGSNNQAPQGPTCLRWECTMILYLSTAMVMMVREDMNTAMQGNVLTSLKIMNCYE